MLNYKGLMSKYELSQKDFDTLYSNVYYKTVQRVGEQIWKIILIDIFEIV
jgi:hypothetical protein